ncbi:pyridoxal-phosphate dependent enzyme [Streptomyces sp. NPDC002133]|uniref:pyridoxal-phosphate dependent enzyme n=1 Tax=Streptomyces sp. NPDC002133 TaxID=3154409 RepID=UPI003322D16D
MVHAEGGRWAADAVRELCADAEPTPLVRLTGPPGELYVKDESAHPSGTLKHRLVRALLCEAVLDGTVREGTTLVMGTGGPAAVAGAYCARRAGLGFVALVPAKTTPAVREAVERYGGRWRIASVPADIQDEARGLSVKLGGHFLDHFADSERALARCPLPDLAEELYGQLAEAAAADPAWLVAGLGTGTTTATLGRYARKRGGPGTRVAGVDAEHSAYFPAWAGGCSDYTTGLPSPIPGIGRPRTEPAFRPELLDLVIPVAQDAAADGLRWLRAEAAHGKGNGNGHGRGSRAASWVGGGLATGAVGWAVRHLLTRMRESAASGSVVMVAGEGAARSRSGPGLQA